MQQVRTIDQERYQVLMERYQAPLLRYVGSIIGNPEAATDIVQDTFIKAFLNLQSFNTKLKFSSWLYRIAHNETINHIKKYRREFMIDDNFWQQLPAPDFGLGEHFDQKLLQSKIAGAIGQLAVKYREPLLLFYFDHKTYAEISDVLRIPVATVATRIRRARSLLKAILIKQGIDHAW